MASDYWQDILNVCYTRPTKINFSLWNIRRTSFFKGAAETKTLRHLNYHLPRVCCAMCRSAIKKREHTQSETGNHQNSYRFCHKKLSQLRIWLKSFKTIAPHKVVHISNFWVATNQRRCLKINEIQHKDTIAIQNETQQSIRLWSTCKCWFWHINKSVWFVWIKLGDPIWHTDSVSDQLIALSRLYWKIEMRTNHEPNNKNCISKFIINNLRRQN